MTQPTEPSSRTDPRNAVRRDMIRLARREAGHRSFWKSLGVLGMVGWPIAFGSAGGALFGHYLDQRFESGLQFTLTLMTAGLMVGCLAAWKAVTEKHD